MQLAYAISMGLRLHLLWSRSSASTETQAMIRQPKHPSPFSAIGNQNTYVPSDILHWCNVTALYRPQPCAKGVAALHSCWFLAGLGLVSLAEFLPTDSLSNVWRTSCGLPSLRFTRIHASWRPREYSMLLKRVFKTLESIIGVSKIYRWSHQTRNWNPQIPLVFSLTVHHSPLWILIPARKESGGSSIYMRSRTVRLV